MKRLRILQTACALASLLMLAACTQDELTDDGGTSLPEGKYPLMLTATQSEVVASPQTRVTDYDENGSHKSEWAENDQIKVVVSGGNNDMETTCTLDANGNITAYNPKLYWKTTQSSKINAWYSNITNQSATTSNTVNLADQSKGLAYVLKADEKSGVDYNSGNISLDFKHQLAKVRVKVVKGSYTGNLSVTAVKVKGYTSCTVTNGAVKAVSGSSLGDISMKNNTYGSDTYWEANLVQGTDAMDKIITIMADGKTATCTLDANISLTAGNVYTFTVKVNTAFSILDTDGNPVAPDKINKDVTITGTSNQPITITGTCNVTLKDVNLSVTGNDVPAIKITDGTIAITVKGKNNELSASQGGGITMSNSASLTIKGDGADKSSLTIKAGDNGYSLVGIGAVWSGKCGDITINQVSLTVSGAKTYDGKLGAAAIGTSAYNSECGNITITQSSVTATGSAGAAAIGLGCAFNFVASTTKCGAIQIESSTINATVTDTNSNGIYGACIGLGMEYDDLTYECGTITITCGDETTFLNNLTYIPNKDGYMDLNYKIGRGFRPEGHAPTSVTFSGGTFNGTLFTDGYSKWQ